jgi:hypothetical protein
LDGYYESCERIINTNNDNLSLFVNQFIKIYIYSHNNSLVYYYLELLYKMPTIGAKSGHVYDDSDDDEQQQATASNSKSD